MLRRRQKNRIPVGCPQCPRNTFTFRFSSVSPTTAPIAHTIVDLNNQPQQCFQNGTRRTEPINVEPPSLPLMLLGKVGSFAVSSNDGAIMTTSDERARPIFTFPQVSTPLQVNLSIQHITVDTSFSSDPKEPQQFEGRRGGRSEDAEEV